MISRFRFDSFGRALLFITAAYDRSAGVGTMTTLLPGVVIIITVLIVWLRTRRTGPARTPNSIGSSVGAGVA
ncbi:hypothetical protein [Microbacterium sp. A94]|uniref:hypothetical protein n=1 Tax=Microbacterium sp. A94 TaxID=3450717 RepID=UPI003F4226C1